MDMPKVNIILSAYNGEKYIEEQLQSLFAQEYPNIDIYVRDDGSTDRTVEILEKYDRQGKIFLIRGENIGFCASFFSLLELCGEGTYWSFCDQDDIWEKDKIKRAVAHLERHTEKEKVPLLYYSLSRMVDENGNDLGIQEPPKGSLCFRRALTGTFGVGFSMVINRKLRNMMLQCDPKAVHSHDWLAGAVALGMGHVIVDKKICAQYRRLDTSVTRISLSRRIQWFLEMLKNEGDVKERNIEFSRCFYNRLPKEKRRLMNLFNRETYSFRLALQKALYPGRWRPSLSSELAMRILMMVGKV
ncbi:glycosyltransferase, group 2 family [Marvinbryantia formatexigens DSM 14469]|uniref:Glycosyltransferase, group 2 family n=1 Tax=Marvinbryantia formatexigens DSM 14469 TaxID=478749 RepID=C6LFI6_9FIRM|nr:glycosyltransferase family 2 protein [Marvinbryantia formatexigens]EET60571.1 glycosyltransferase, group 2 family [Marvinbryantia formatexigens DSM 14469]UWO25566.1 glycosyltransferase family 2 protein [Marvinbryantia formatexigens DSM 14469]SDG19545.1 Glycosyltransferase involved in cell wall bisynthesis [Marvinbryantia formatexigens]